MKSKVEGIRAKIREKVYALDKGRALYTAFILPSAMTLLPTTAFAANDTIWTKASEIMKDVYSQVLGISTIAAKDRHLYDRARDMLARFEGVRVLAPHCRGSVLLFYHDRMPSDALGAALDRHGICVRAGFHCAALGHRTLGTPDAGAVRISFGMDTMPSDLDALYGALKDILL